MSDNDTAQAKQERIVITSNIGDGDKFFVIGEETVRLTDNDTTTYLAE